MKINAVIAIKDSELMRRKTPLQNLEESKNTSVGQGLVILANTLYLLKTLVVN